MFARVAVVATLFALPLLAAAGNCNTGGVQCCESYEDSKSAAGATLLKAIGVNLQDVTGQIGFKCSPISVIGAGGNSACSQQPVCCQNNNVGGAISIGCLPIEL
ncbi:fungal hydrophobin [Dichomitus squalens]|uniref:Hydrophobin n=1 Tax=Dichomitus squalens TaxID=114155 RepID=A0A4Q9P4C5_9APHY|nr:fungal hydrophobin [Dichomitus squalens LYAD-421 SS1]EJF63702.1 fungal hydrophobin [Dichomitus squalens LYAD-421 SS1]TBU48968.1 fungal hydrophobin [Dichomitus squalens]TBU59268.1 fungal hydrophobin [Dichomitus squalens]